MTSPSPAASPQARAFADEHAAWHAGVEERRMSPHGPLSVTALHWLAAEPQRWAGVPGAWGAEPDDTVVAQLDADDGVAFEGRPAVGEVRIGPLTGIESAVLEWGERRIEVAARGGRIALRPRDPASPDLAAYAGTAVFPADPAWVVPGRFVPSPRGGVEVGSAAAGVTHRYDSPGRAEFEIGGRSLALTLFGDDDATEFQAVFANETGADLTFPSARFATAVRTGGDTVVIDFNRTVNPPCAYSASATCPFPPPENRLPVRIEAGELRPGAVH